MRRGAHATTSDEAHLTRIVESKASVERRGEKRHIALLRVALLHAGGIKDLCVVKNMSSAGLAAQVYRQLPSNDTVRIEFRSGEMLSGSVVWQRDWEVGIVFPAPIDVGSVLASRWVTDGRRRNLPRIELSCRGQLKKGVEMHDVVLQDISQGGARVHIERPLDRGSVVLSLPDLPPLAGVVQWASGTDAGISFNECISFDPLARWIQAHRSAASVE